MPFDCPIVPRRSFIFAPGLKPEMYPKALASGADIVCVELEDGIAPKDKDAARANALALFAEPQADGELPVLERRRRHGGRAQRREREGAQRR